MQLYGVKYIQFLGARKYSLEQKCERIFSVLWLFLAFVTFCFKCPHRVDLAHPFWAPAIFPVHSSIRSCCTTRKPSTVFLCLSSLLQGELVVCKGHPLLLWPCEYVCHWFHYQPSFLDVVLAFLLPEKADTDVFSDSSLLPIRTSQHPQ